MKKENINEILEVMNRIRKQKKKICTNYYYSYNASDVLFDVWEMDETVIFCIQELEIYRVFYYSCNIEELTDALSKMPEGAILDIIEKQDTSFKEWIDLAGFQLYSVYGRFGIQLPDFEEQKSILEKSRMNKFYNENYGQYANQEDLRQIQKLIAENFDVKTDHLFTDEQMRQLIHNNCVYIEKEEGDIICIVIYQIEGKKLYYNLTYNKGTADISYSIERKIQLQAIRNYGVNYIYSWIDMSNIKALKRNSSPTPHLYNYIYQKRR